jgi:hypothetical protein
MDILDRADKIEIDFADDFTSKLGKTAAYETFSLFRCERVQSLQDFLTKDYNGIIKPYIIWDNEYKIIVGYFTLIATCMISSVYEETKPNHYQEKDVERIIPCVELQHFALNDKYLDLLTENGYDNKKVGQYIFKQYITEVIVILSSQINFRYVVLHAINNLKVINSYRNMGFQTFEDDANNVVPLLTDVMALHYDYAGECKFMMKDIDAILSDYERR